MANVITVTALNRYVKTLLERDSVLTDVALRGEISNFTNHYKTGHFYFSLKDEQCSVKAVMFRRDAQNLAFMPQNGMRVIVRCRISLFERDGAFQVYVEDMFPDGIGAMQMAFEQLKEKLDKEGLFAPEHKKPLPAMPKCVGLVTSKTGAALQDILNVTQRRYPIARFLLYSVTVQGNEAAPEIANAITRLDKGGRVDVIIVARGGGSREDLWVFNNESIARAAFASSTPVVSAVGHEIDFSILDFVADLRAPTPSAAAELVMPDMEAELREIRRSYSNICKEIQNRLQLCYNRVRDIEAAPQLAAARSLPLGLLRELSEKADAARTAMHGKMDAAKGRVAHAAMLCGSLSPYSVLCAQKQRGRFGGRQGRGTAGRRTAGLQGGNDYYRGRAMKKEMTFEAAGTELDAILAELSDSETPLDRSLVLYARAAELIAFCNETLQKAQITIDEIDAKNAGKQE